MNKAQLQKNVGSRVRPRPQATEALGAHDDDWTVREVSDETLELVNERTGHVATLGLDAVKTYTSDPGRDAGGVKYGFLSLTVAVKLLEDGKSDIEPLPFGRGEAPAPNRRVSARLNGYLSDIV